MSIVQKNEDGLRHFQSEHFHLIFDQATGALNEVRRTADGARLFVRRGPATLRLCVGGEPSINRIPEPDPQATDPGPVPIEHYMGPSYDPAIWPHENPMVAPTLPEVGRLVGGEAALAGFEVVDKGDDVEIVVLQEEGDWRFGVTYGLQHDLPVLRVDVLAEYRGDGTGRLNYVAWPWHGWRFASEPALPGFERRIRSLADGGNLVLWRSGEGEWWMWDALTGDDPAQGTLKLQLGMGGLVSKGERLSGGQFYLGLSEAADGATGGEILAAWNAAHGVRGIPQVPDWGRSANIYETYIGWAPLRGGDYAPHPTTEDLIADLPRIRDLGYDTIYIMPRHPWPGYAWASFTDPAVQHGDGPGTGERFRALIDAIHDQGMRVILDIITAGVIDQECVRWMSERRQARRDAGIEDAHWEIFELRHDPIWREHSPEVHPYWAEHPEWFAQLEDGRPHIHFSKKLDTRHPGLQSFLAESLVGLLTDYGVDGFRIDAPWWGSYCYRWQQGAGYRASWSIGATGPFVARLREATQQVRQDALFFVETATPDLIACRHANLVYGSDELPVTRGLLEGAVSGEHREGRELFGIEGALWLAGAEASAQQARRSLAFLRQYRLPGMPVVHWVDCHDSVWFAAAGEQWTREMYGLDATRALLALCCFLDGALMTFAGGERGVEEETAKLLRLRRELAPLRAGHCDELAVGCDHERVLPVWRELEGEWLVGVINFSDRPARASLRLPLPEVPPLVDHLGVAKLEAPQGATVGLELPPYGAALLGAA